MYMFTFASHTLRVMVIYVSRSSKTAPWVVRVYQKTKMTTTACIPCMLRCPRFAARVGPPCCHYNWPCFSQVERAQPKGNTGIARPWSKHSEGSSRAQKLAETKARKEGSAKDKKLKEADGASSGKGAAVAAAAAAAGPARGKVEKEEFMAALKKRSEARFWDNDDALLASSQGAAASAAGGREDGDDGSDAASSGDDRSSQEASNGSDSDEEVEEEGATGSGRSDKDARAVSGGVSDMDWLRSKVDKGGGEGEAMATASEDGGSESEPEGDEADSGQAADATEGGSGKRGKHALGGASGREASGGAKQAGRKAGDGDDSERGGEEEEEEESGLSVGRLFVRNLPYTCTEDDLRELFGGFGMLSEVHLPVDDVKRVRVSVPQHHSTSVPVCFRSSSVQGKSLFIFLCVAGRNPCDRVETNALAVQ